jgi:hypothetical protein
VPVSARSSVAIQTGSL